ncbi:MAG: recombinase family protein [Bacteroidaceae bacterium]|nr:recombinase family protein [Bacteroidaceae bacterium]
MNDEAVIYARVSSVSDRQDTSRQIRDLQRLAKEKSLKIVKTYEEHISGAKKTQERPVLTECLDYCISNHVSVLLISELSRLGRNVDDVLSNVKLCKDNHLNVYFQKEQLSIFNADGKEHPFLTIFIAVLGTCAQMERENIKFRLNSGKAQFIAKGGKVGRKVGYKKSDEKLQEQYATVIKQLRKGYPIRMIAKNCGCGISTVQRIKKKFIDNEN